MNVRGRVMRATATARNLAKQHGLDLSQIQGTGTDGLITVGDVLGRIHAPEPTNLEKPPTETRRTALSWLKSVIVIIRSPLIGVAYVILIVFTIIGIVGYYLGVAISAPIGFIIGVIRTFLWDVGVDDGPEASCKGCDQEVDRKLDTCANCGTPVRYPLGAMPKKLTPSDLVVLEMMPRSTGKLQGVVRVNVDDPPTSGIERLLATALLANEEVGALLLEVVEGKVVAVMVGNSPEWPTGSLESELCKQGSVSDIIYDWLVDRVDDPKSLAVKRVMAKMVDRTVLEVDKKRVLKLFTMTSSDYVLPERTSALVNQRPVLLLEECQQNRPDVHDQLTKDIAIGFDRRTLPYD